jgi:anti-sigma factor RsiW
MNTDALNTNEVERLFLLAVDDSLDATDAEAFRTLLAQQGALKERFEKYRSAVKALKSLPKERAPDALASLIVRRAKRRRFNFRSLAMHEVAYRVPVEVIIPLLLAAVVAAFLLLAAR